MTKNHSLPYKLESLGRRGKTGKMAGKMAVVLWELQGC
jgi:hypothetical protein